MVPPFTVPGNLPPGIHPATWSELAARFGAGARRAALLAGLLSACEALRRAGCRAVYVDGSFVTAKPEPNDFDACWDVSGVDPALLDAVFLTFDNGRAAQKARFLGEFFPAQLPEGLSGRTFLQFFQTDRATGAPKGIVMLDLETLP